jgi:uncharacterized protein (TIGR02118 family)
VRGAPSDRPVADLRLTPVSFPAKAPPSLEQREDRMAQLVVMYKTPTDPAAFDDHYFGKHVPIAKRIPGLRNYDVSRGPVATPAGPSAYHLVAVLEFDDLAAIQNAFASPEGQAAVADVQSFATGGVEMVMYETRRI